MSLKAIIGILAKVIGLDPMSIGHSAIKQVVHRRMSAIGLTDMGQYLGLLHSSSDELQELIEVVTVPETWFFRDTEAFNLLKRFAVEEWRPQSADQSLRLASIPCSTGEEPYSMVMGLLDCGLEPERFHIDAVDVSNKALIQANQALYGEVSFRGKELGFRQRYFEARPEGYRLHKRVCRNVTFHQGNILNLSTLLAGRRYDVVFFRNLLIYLNQDSRKRTIDQLRQLLSPSGLLFVGHAEASLLLNAGFTRVPHARAFAFTPGSSTTSCLNTEQLISKKTAISDTPGEKAAVPASFTPHGSTASRVLAPASSVIATPSNPEPVDTGPEQGIDLKNVRRLADQGRLEEARRLCEDHLRGGQGSTAEAYYLFGLIHEAGGNREQAAELYRKAIYLDPVHEPTLIQLVLFAERSGNTHKAQLLRERVARASARNGDHPRMAG